jgi:hypothetical protein
LDAFVTVLERILISLAAFVSMAMLNNSQLDELFFMGGLSSA